MDTLALHALRQEHERLRIELHHIRAAARELPDLSPEERSLLVARVVDFLRGTLLPFAAAEEQGLYAEVRRVLGDPRVTDTMEYDHRAIARLTETLAATPIRWTEQLQDELYSLSALIDVHLEKEENIYLELVEEANAGQLVIAGDPSWRETF